MSRLPRHSPAFKAGAIVALLGIVALVLALVAGDAITPRLWGIEPMAYVGALLLITGLGITTLSAIVRVRRDEAAVHQGLVNPEVAQKWEQFIREYFELFDHDMARPLRRILDRERELAAIIKASGARPAPGVQELLDEIELQAPSYRLMMSNIQVLMRLEGPQSAPAVDAIEPSQIVRKIVERYTTLCVRHQKEISWWSEPPVLGIVHADGAALEHILTNLVDNAVRYASGHVEVCWQSAKWDTCLTEHFRHDQVALTSSPGLWL